MKIEIWKEVIGHEGKYEVSNLGKVRNIKRNTIQKGHETTKGYLVVSISHKQTLLHRIIATAFVPNPDNKETVNHINGIKTDNRIENLEWLTNGENMAHASKLGLLSGKGQTSHNVILSESQVIEMRKQGNEGLKAKEIAANFNISVRQTHSILSGESWKKLLNK